MIIAVGCDHGGFALKEAVVAWLRAQGHTVEDFGCYDTASVDYAPIAAQAARCVAQGRADKGVLICSTGIGISMAANKVRGIRAAVCASPHQALMTRRHNNANILCMGGLIVDPDTALRMTEIFLSTPFDGDDPSGARHQRRVAQIAQIEEEELSHS